MQELLIVNPAKRPSKRRKSSKPASPAQKRARAAFAAAARARAGKPRRKSAKRRKSSSPVLFSNPRKRSSSRKVSVRRRRNPISTSNMLKKPLSMITPALLGAGGAIAVNTVLAKLPLPPVMMTGRMRYLTQGVTAIALAAIAQKVGVKGSTAAQMAEGALTVTLHQAITDLAAGMGMNLSGMQMYMPGMVPRAVPSRSSNPAQLNGMGKYVTGPGARSNVMSMRGLARQTQKKTGFGF